MAFRDELSEANVFILVPSCLSEGEHQLFSPPSLLFSYAVKIFHLQFSVNQLIIYYLYIVGYFSCSALKDCSYATPLTPSSLLLNQSPNVANTGEGFCLNTSALRFQKSFSSTFIKFSPHFKLKSCHVFCFECGY